MVQRDGFLGSGVEVGDLTVDWPNEEYVRVYTRETGDDLDLSWEALALWRAMLVKFDKSGLVVARNGWISVARMTRIPSEVVQRVGPELLSDGRLQQVNGGFFAPNYTEAQTASKSDKVRQRESRDRRRESAAVQAQDITTACHAASHAVTPSHERSQNVTLCSALPPSAKPLPGYALLPVTPASPVKQGTFEDLAVKADKAVRDREQKRRLPDDWMPCRSEATLEAERIAVARGVNLSEQLANLRDWAKGNNAKKSDWDATWRNWTRNAKPSGPPKTQIEQQFDRIAMLREQERTEEGDS